VICSVKKAALPVAEGRVLVVEVGTPNAPFNLSVSVSHPVFLALGSGV
jgi:hypothetical protein